MKNRQKTFRSFDPFGAQLKSLLIVLAGLDPFGAGAEVSGPPLPCRRAPDLLERPFRGAGTTFSGRATLLTPVVLSCVRTCSRSCGFVEISGSQRRA
jgi:hypothetical protein